MLFRSLERLGVLGDGLDAPLAGRVGRLGVENVERELGFGNRERLLEEVEVLLWTFGRDVSAGSKGQWG